MLCSKAGNQAVVLTMEMRKLNWMQAGSDRMGNIGVAEFMSHPVATIGADVSLGEAAHRMVTRNISGLPVVDRQGALIGLVTEADFLRAVGVPCRHPACSVWQTLKTIFSHHVSLQQAEDPVSALMVSHVVTVTPEQTLQDVFVAMKRYRIKRIVVCDEQRRVRGIVTRSDMIRVFFDRVFTPGLLQEHSNVHYPSFPRR